VQGGKCETYQLFLSEEDKVTDDDDDLTDQCYPERPFLQSPPHIERQHAGHKSLTVVKGLTERGLFSPVPLMSHNEGLGNTPPGPFYDMERECQRARFARS